MNIRKEWFTLVELIVVVTVLAILWTIGFINLMGYNTVARDTVRMSDVNNIIKVIKLSRLETWTYPVVTNGVDISFSWSTIWTQWSFWSGSHADVRRISEPPIDPLTGNEYAYSITSQTGEFQVWAILENKNTTYLPSLRWESHAVENLSEFATNFVKGNYNGQFITYAEWIISSLSNIYILWVPSIMSNTVVTKTLDEIHADNGFIYPWSTSAPWTYSWLVTPWTPWNSWVTDTSWDIAIIYQWTNQELSTRKGKIDLITQLQDYYTGSDVANTNDFQGISSIDPVTDPDQAVSFVNTLLNVWVGWLNGEIHNISQSIITETPSDCSLPWWGVIISGQTTTAYQASSVAHWSTCSSQTRSCSNGTLLWAYGHETCSVDEPPLCSETDDITLGSHTLAPCNLWANYVWDLGTKTSYFSSICPSWYHIPTAPEWEGISSTNLQWDANIPGSGYKGFWSSTTYLLEGGPQKTYYLNSEFTPTQMTRLWTAWQTALLYSRCFKN